MCHVTFKHDDDDDGGSQDGEKLKKGRKVYDDAGCGDCVCVCACVRDDRMKIESDIQDFASKSLHCTTRSQWS